LAGVVTAGLVLAVGIVLADVVDQIVRALYLPLRPKRFAVLVAVLAPFVVIAHTLVSRHSSYALLFGAMPGARRGRRLGRRVADLPATFLLPVMVAFAAAVRIGLSSTASTPRILGDELIYSDLARSLAVGDGFSVRGVADIGHSVLFPAILAPIFALVNDGYEAYEWVKVVNAIAAASAAVPIYLVAIRLLSRGWSLSLALVAVAPIFTAYSSFVMTESLSYPLGAWFVLALVRALDRPTFGRQIGLVAVLAVCAGVRPQAVAFVPATLTAVLLVGGFRGRRSRLRAFAPTWVMFGTGGLVLAISAFVASAPGGDYGSLAELPNAFDLVKWTIWNLVPLEFGVGVIAFAVFPAAILFLSRAPEPALRSVGAACLAVLIWTIVAVAVLSASPFGLDRLHERNLFFVSPFVLLCATKWFLATRASLTPPLIAGVVAAVALPLCLRPGLVIAGYDSLSSFPWAEIHVSVSFVPITVLMSALVVAVIAAAWRWPTAAIVMTLCIIIVTSATTELPSVDRRDALRRLTWVDGAIPDGSRALLIHASSISEGCAPSHDSIRTLDLAIWTEFFNSDVGDVVNIRAPGWGFLASAQAEVRPDGVVVVADSPLRHRYVIVGSDVVLEGKPLKRLDADAVSGAWDGPAAGSLTLWAAEQPLTLTNPGIIFDETNGGADCQAARQ
jgi:hypothetical protein